MAREGGGGDGRAVCVSNQTMALRWQRASKRHYGSALERCVGERGGESESERMWVGARDAVLFTAHSGLTGGFNADVRPPHGAHGVRWSATTAATPVGSDRWRSRLTAHFWTSKSPKPWWIFENFINTTCRATWVLQDCLKEFGLIPNNFHTTMLQSNVHWYWNQFRT